MSDIILHHYPLSPFSEKTRKLLAYLDLPWQSVEESAFLPRPELMEMTGGYRRIPVMQRGADIYCDTRLICRLLSEQADKEHLYANKDSVALAEWSDTRLFQVALTAAMGLQILGKFRDYFSFSDAMKMLADRIKMGKGANMPKLGPKQAKQELQVFLKETENNLNSAYLFGDEPTIADFSSYHPLYFGQVLMGAGYMDDFPKLLAWLNRMQTLGDGHSTPMSQGMATQIAADSKPAPLPEPVELGEFKIGDPVEIAPSDYGVSPSIGTLAGSDAQSWTLHRQTLHCGDLHVHYPKTGYRIEKLTS